MSAPVNVLVSSAGRRVALVRAFRHALEVLGLGGEVLACDQSRLASALHVADRSFQVAPCAADEFIDQLLTICREQSVALLVPTIDTELPVLAEHRESFSAIGTTVALSAPETVAIAMDKALTHEWLVRNEFATVEQAPIDAVRAAPDGWRYPLVVKPRRGSASLGVHMVHDLRQLEAAASSDSVVQTMAPGVEHTVDVLVNKAGRAVCCVPRRRLEVRAGEVSKGVTVRSPVLEQLARRIAERLPGAYGPLNVQMFLDDSNEARVIEINPRFGGGFPLSEAAGAAFPKWLLEEVMDRPSTATTDGWKDGLLMLRYDDAVFVDHADDLDGRPSV